MSARFAGRTALVTGASRGVGRGIALRLAAEGARVAVNYRRDADAATEVVDRIVGAGGRAVAYAAAVDDHEAVDAMVAQVRHDLGPVDLVVSNAGTASRGRTLADSPDEDHLEMLRVHTLGPLHLLRALLPDLRAAARGDVVVVSSSSVSSTPAGAAPYTMAKAAMETAVFTLAREEREHGVRANIVAPGLVETEMGRRLVRAATGGGGLDEVAARSPFGRVCTPEDVGGVVVFLASEDAAYLTGQRVVVDGGGPATALF